ncbi:hypothetical protein CANCADRAFT_30726 [Tortispora caseinolytica NRRL Y-17796]|uniref:ferric-chelate reductase (NADPH) n=1 Tax=Tortispora caseinolytica NRRL Y-17796 TaxID=767744 RepID=A0A1E4TLJ4_9ASCO|nr:hypothetical protein CANCADRAFT_30726 [Tortispora caseinolytica NRRL Y-17796]
MFKDNFAPTENTDADLERAWGRVLEDWCHNYGEVNIDDFQTVLNNATQYAINASTVVVTSRHYEPLTFTEQLISGGYRAAKAYWQNQYTSMLFGWSVMIYFAGLILISTVFRSIRLISPRVGRALISTPHLNRARGYLTMPPTLGQKRADPWTIGRLPMGSALKRGETLILIGYLILMVVFLTTDYPFYDGNMRLKTMNAQWTKYLGDRSGKMAIMHLPLIIMFAGRNNIISWLTGWSFDTINVLHRWVARGMWLTAIIHGGVYTYVNGYKYSYYLEQDFFVYGICAMVIASVIILLAIYVIRHASYEVFYYGHFIFVLVFLVMMYEHVKILGFTNWVYVSFGVWGFDRVVRCLRILWAGIWTTGQFTVENGAVKVALRTKRPLNLKPGSYIFLHVPRIGLFQSHPFSVCEVKPNNEFTLMIKPMSGMTGTLEQYVQKMHNMTVELRVWIDGAYGHTAPVEDYDNVLVIGGGVGITALYGYLDMLKEYTATEDEKASSVMKHKNVLFVWTVRNPNNVAWVDLEPMITCGIEVQVYVTNSSSTEKMTEKEAIVKTTGISESVITYGKRPDLESTISSWMRLPGSAAIVTCGPGSMNDECRNIVARNLRTCNNTIGYYEESFSW